MRKILAILGILFLYSIPAHGQTYPNPPAVGLLANRPTFCANLPQFYYATDNTTLYFATVAGTTCTWAAVGGGGGSGFVTGTGLTSGQPVLGAGSSAVAIGAINLAGGSAYVTNQLPVSNGGTGVGTITGPIKGNGTSPFSAAASADIIGLWSGTCNSGSFLNGAGACAAAPTIGTGTANALTYWSSSTALGSIAGVITGQLPVAQNGAAPTFVSAGIADGNGGAAVTASTYAIQCDSATTTIDRTTTLRFQSGAATVTAPDHTGSGCGSNMSFVLIDDGAGTLTVNRGGSDTFTVVDGATNTDSATSFTLGNGQYATLNNGAGGIWEVRKVVQSASPAFNDITGGTNTGAAMLVGTGASLGPTGSGTINSTAIGGVTVTGTPSTGQVPTATGSTAATWQTPAGGGGPGPVYSGSPTVTAQAYVPFGGGSASSATETNVQTYTYVPQPIANLGVVSSAVPGGGNSLIVTLRDSAFPEALSCTILAASNTCVDTTDVFTPNAGDKLDWSITPTGTVVITPIITISSTFGLVPAGGIGTPAFVQAKSCFGTTTCNISITNTGTNHMFAAIESAGPATLTISDANSNTYTVVNPNLTSGASTQEGAAETWETHNIANGSNTITCGTNNGGGGLNLMLCVVGEWSDGLTGSEEDVKIAAAGSGTNPQTTSSGTSASTSYANEIIFNILGFQDASTPAIAAGSGYTIPTGGVFGSCAQCIALEYKTVSVLGTQTGTYGLSGGSGSFFWTNQLAAFH